MNTDSWRSSIGCPDDTDLERMPALYRDACSAAGIQPLPEDEARESAPRKLALLRPAFKPNSASADGSKTSLFATIALRVAAGTTVPRSRRR